MTDTAISADLAPSSSSTIYFVVPLLPQPTEDCKKLPDKILRCAYFNTAWQRVAANQIDTSDGNDSITFLQQRRVPEAGMAALQIDGSQQDTDVSLFAGVAKTFMDNCNMPRTFLAQGPDGGSWIDVPVAKGTRRGVILIFRNPAEGETEQLLATADPEIRNGSSS